LHNISFQHYTFAFCSGYVKTEITPGRFYTLLI